MVNCTDITTSIFKIFNKLTDTNRNGLEKKWFKITGSFDSTLQLPIY